MALDPNISLTESDNDDSLFHLCWRRQSCSQCLSEVNCSWCAISSTCVPNAGRVPILAPIGSDQICPLGSKERWEMRSRPLGCNVSTLTFLSIIVSVSGTVALVAIALLVISLVRRAHRRLKQTEFEGFGEPQDSWFAWLDLSSLLLLVGISSEGESQTQTQTQTQGQGVNQALVEEGQEDAETRPLLA